MKEKLDNALFNLNWLCDRMDELNERINDYIFLSCCDLDPKNTDHYQLEQFNAEYNELKARYEKELREIEKLTG